jgi:hypothetical protein
VAMVVISLAAAAQVLQRAGPATRKQPLMERSQLLAKRESRPAISRA